MDTITITAIWSIVVAVALALVLSQLERLAFWSTRLVATEALRTVALCTITVFAGWIWSSIRHGRRMRVPLRTKDGAGVDVPSTSAEPVATAREPCTWDPLYEDGSGAELMQIVRAIGAGSDIPVCRRSPFSEMADADGSMLLLVLCSAPAAVHRLSYMLPSDRYRVAVFDSLERCLQFLDELPFLPDCMAVEQDDLAGGAEQAIAAVRRRFGPADLPILRVIRNVASAGAAATAAVGDTLLAPFEPKQLEALVSARVTLRRQHQQRAAVHATLSVLHHLLPPPALSDLMTRGSPWAARTHDDVSVVSAQLLLDPRSFAAANATPGDGTTTSPGDAVQCSPVSLMTALHEVYAAFDELCQAHGITKVGMLGDKYLAAGGLDGSPDHLRRAMRAAAGMVAAVEARRRRHREQQLGQEREREQQGERQPHLDQQRRRLGAASPHVTWMSVQIGVHTGPCTAGVVGRMKPTYTLVGEAVSGASQLRRTGHPMCVHVSCAVRERLQLMSAAVATAATTATTTAAGGNPCADNGGGSNAGVGAGGMGTNGEEFTFVAAAVPPRMLAGHGRGPGASGSSCKTYFAKLGDWRAALAALGAWPGSPSPAAAPPPLGRWSGSGLTCGLQSNKFGSYMPQQQQQQQKLEQQQLQQGGVVWPPHSIHRPALRRTATHSRRALLAAATASAAAAAAAGNGLGGATAAQEAGSVGGRSSGFRRASAPPAGIQETFSRLSAGAFSNSSAEAELATPLPLQQQHLHLQHQQQLQPRRLNPGEALVEAGAAGQSAPPRTARPVATSTTTNTATAAVRASGALSPPRSVPGASAAAAEFGSVVAAVATSQQQFRTGPGSHRSPPTRRFSNLSSSTSLFAPSSAASAPVGSSLQQQMQQQQHLYGQGHWVTRGSSNEIYGAGTTGSTVTTQAQSSESLSPYRTDSMPEPYGSNAIRMPEPYTGTSQWGFMPTPPTVLSTTSPFTHLPSALSQSLSPLLHPQQLDAPFILSLQQQLQQQQLQLHQQQQQLQQQQQCYQHQHSSYGAGSISSYLAAYPSPSGGLPTVDEDFGIGVPRGFSGSLGGFTAALSRFSNSMALPNFNSAQIPNSNPLTVNGTRAPTAATLSSQPEPEQTAAVAAPLPAPEDWNAKADQMQLDVEGSGVNGVSAAAAVRVEQVQASCGHDSCCCGAQEAGCRQRNPGEANACCCANDATPEGVLVGRRSLMGTQMGTTDPMHYMLCTTTSTTTLDPVACGCGGTAVPSGGGGDGGGGSYAAAASASGVRGSTGPATACTTPERTTPGISHSELMLLLATSSVAMSGAGNAMMGTGGGVGGMGITDVSVGGEGKESSHLLSADDRDHPITRDLPPMFAKTLAGSLGCVATAIGAASTGGGSGSIAAEVEGLVSIRPGLTTPEHAVDSSCGFFSAIPAGAEEAAEPTEKTAAALAFAACFGDAPTGTADGLATSAPRILAPPPSQLRPSLPPSAGDPNVASVAGVSAFAVAAAAAGTLSSEPSAVISLDTPMDATSASSTVLLNGTSISAAEFAVLLQAAGRSVSGNSGSSITFPHLQELVSATLRDAGAGKQPVLGSFSASDLQSYLQVITGSVDNPGAGSSHDDGSDNEAVTNGSSRATTPSGAGAGNVMTPWRRRSADIQRALATAAAVGAAASAAAAAAAAGPASQPPFQQPPQLQPPQPHQLDGRLDGARLAGVGMQPWLLGDAATASAARPPTAAAAAGGEVAATTRPHHPQALFGGNGGSTSGAADGSSGSCDGAAAPVAHGGSGAAVVGSGTGVASGLTRRSLLAPGFPVNITGARARPAAGHRGLLSSLSTVADLPTPPSSSVLTSRSRDDSRNPLTSQPLPSGFSSSIIGLASAAGAVTSQPLAGMYGVHVSPPLPQGYSPRHSAEAAPYLEGNTAMSAGGPMGRGCQQQDVQQQQQHQAQQPECFYHNHGPFERTSVPRGERTRQPMMVVLGALAASAEAAGCQLSDGDGTALSTGAPDASSAATMANAATSTTTAAAVLNAAAAEADVAGGRVRHMGSFSTQRRSNTSTAPTGASQATATAAGANIGGSASASTRTSATSGSGYRTTMGPSAVGNTAGDGAGGGGGAVSSWTQGRLSLSGADLSWQGVDSAVLRTTGSSAAALTSSMCLVATNQSLPGNGGGGGNVSSGAAADSPSLPGSFEAAWVGRMTATRGSGSTTGSTTAGGVGGGGGGRRSAAVSFAAAFFRRRSQQHRLPAASPHAQMPGHAHPPQQQGQIEGKASRGLDNDVAAALRRQNGSSGCAVDSHSPAMNPCCQGNERDEDERGNRAGAGAAADGLMTHGSAGTSARATGLQSRQGEGSPDLGQGRSSFKRRGGEGSGGGAGSALAGMLRTLSFGKRRGGSHSSRSLKP